MFGSSVLRLFHTWKCGQRPELGLCVTAVVLWCVPPNCLENLPLALDLPNESLFQIIFTLQSDRHFLTWYRTISWYTLIPGMSQGRPVSRAASQSLSGPAAIRVSLQQWTLVWLQCRQTFFCLSAILLLFTFRRVIFHISIIHPMMCGRRQEVC